MKNNTERANTYATKNTNEMQIQDAGPMDFKEQNMSAGLAEVAAPVPELQKKPHLVHGQSNFR